MANVRHSSLVGTDLHEPKGAATANVGEVYIATGTGTGAFKKIVTDANATVSNIEPKGIIGATSEQVYVANGAGSGVWKDGAGSLYGSMRVVNNATTQSITIASDITLKTDTDYAKVDTGIWQVGYVNGLSFNSSGYLLVPTTGIYELSFWTSYAVSVINTLTAFKFSTGDSNLTLVSPKAARLSGTVGDVGSASMSLFVPLTAGAKVSIWVAASKTCTITMQDATCSAVLLKAG